MAEFLTTTGVSYRIEDIITNSEEYLTLVSPYLKFSKTLYERLKDATSRGIVTTIVFGKSELDYKQNELLETLPCLRVFYFENLHAKCYFNEKNMVITSMNMYEFSEKNNREMGIFLDRKKDNQMFEEASKETESIIASAELDYSSIHETNNATKQSNNQHEYGSCIRCARSIPLNPHAPYCPDCYHIWTEYGNPYYEEKVCHCCKKPEYTTIQKPMCYSCYKKHVY